MKIRAALTAICIMFAASALAAAMPSPFGNWARDDGSTRINIAPCGAQICAVNTWVKDPNGKEKVGDRLIMTLSPASSSVLHGKAYDERRKMNFAMTLTLQDQSMKTSGCMFFGTICKTAQWTRIN